MDVSERAGIEIPEKSVENPLKIGETFITANTVLQPDVLILLKCVRLDQ